MTKPHSIQTIPTVELRSQTINALHRQEFVIEFTRSVFMPRVVEATPRDMGDWKKDLEAQVHMLRDAFPLLKKPEVREVYGRTVAIHNAIRWDHETFQSALRGIDSYRIATKLLNVDRLQDNIEGRARSFSAAMSTQIKARMPNVEASSKYQTELQDATRLINSKSTEAEGNACYIYLPHTVGGLIDLITEKKSQDPNTGEVTRTPVIKTQFVKAIPKSVQTRILAWIKKKRATVSTEALESEMRLMFEFSRELHEGVRIIRNTKQFQQRLPDMFDDFCFITGLGQCDGKDLMCGTEMGTVNTILAQYKK